MIRGLGITRRVALEQTWWVPRIMVGATVGATYHFVTLAEAEGAVTWLARA